MSVPIEFAKKLLEKLDAVAPDSTGSLDFGDIEIEILPKGVHTSSNGFKLPVSDRELNDLVASYNPANFRAPLIVTHDTKGVPDPKLAESEFAYGVPKMLKRVGDKVKAVFDRVAPEFAQWVKEGKLLAVSPSFYLPDSPSNPTPGKLSLRHIAALGKTPPAIKGMEPLQKAFAANFNASDEGVINFSFQATNRTVEFCDMGDQLVAQTFQNLRDWMISQFGLEAADRVIPASVVGMLYTSAADDDDEDDDEETGENQGYNGMTTSFSERERQLEAREQEIKNREAAIRKSEFTNFCATELRGRLIPSISPVEEVVQFMEFLHSSDPIDFSEGEAKPPLEWFKGLLQRLPQQVSFGEVAKGAPVDVGNSPVKGTFDASEVDADRKIRAYMNQHKVSYAEAMTALGFTY